jgi:multicomponent Na+:H+ antiporter subunit B
MERPRLVILAVGLALLAGILAAGLHGVHAVGAYSGPYGDIINAVAQRERNVTDMVTAVNFDYRAIDTVGEEFVLFISASAVAFVLRRARDEDERPAQDDLPGDGPAGDAVRLVCLALVGPLLVLGLYIVAHGQLSPGGGFQGGAILATSLLLMYLAGQRRRLQSLVPMKMIEAADAIGAAGFVLIGLAALAAGSALLTNVLPFGNAADLSAGGTIPLISASIGLEVTAALLLIVRELLGQAGAIRPARRGGR